MKRGVLVLIILLMTVFTVNAYYYDCSYDTADGAEKQYIQYPEEIMDFSEADVLCKNYIQELVTSGEIEKANHVSATWGCGPHGKREGEGLLTECICDNGYEHIINDKKFGCYKSESQSDFSALSFLNGMDCINVNFRLNSLECPSNSLSCERVKSYASNFNNLCLMGCKSTFGKTSGDILIPLQLCSLESQIDFNLLSIKSSDLYEYMFNRHGIKELTLVNQIHDYIFRNELDSNYDLDKVATWINKLYEEEIDFSKFDLYHLFKIEQYENYPEVKGENKLEINRYDGSAVRGLELGLGFATIGEAQDSNYDSNYLEKINKNVNKLIKPYLFLYPNEWICFIYDLDNNVQRFNLDCRKLYDWDCKYDDNKELECTKIS